MAEGYELIELEGGGHVLCDTHAEQCFEHMLRMLGLEPSH